MKKTRSESAPHATRTPTGDRADKHTKTAEPQQTIVSGENAERSAEHVLRDSSLTPRDVREQASYRGLETDVGQQAATSTKAGEHGEQVLHEDRG